MPDTINIVKIGNPLLRKKSIDIQDAEFGTLELKMLAEQLFKAMDAEKGIGLAAPQIGINKRAIVFGMNNNTFSIPYTVLFNPSFRPTSDEIIEDYEACLSVGLLHGKVPRFRSIYYQGYDIEGVLVQREASDLHARVVQHEIDHLDGIVFLDKVTNHESLGFYDELMAAGLIIPRNK
jgi:peptide deformylase